MNLVQWAKRSPERQVPQPWPQITLDQALAQFGSFGYQGLGYGAGLVQTISQKREEIQADFTGFIEGAYKSNGAVFACMMVRMLLFSEARFQFRQMNNGRPGKLFGTRDLKILESPFGPNSTTGDLLLRAITDVDIAGNFYCTRVPDRSSSVGSRIARLRPDWVTIVKGSPEDNTASAYDPTAELVGYVYTPGGPGSGIAPKLYLPNEVAHFAPIPDPSANYRGMSWIQPIVAEVMGDRAMTEHKISFFTAGATPNLVVSMDTGRMDRKSFKEWVDVFEQEHAGALNAYKTLYLGQGASATVVGSNMKDLDYHAVQGQGESRIAAAAGVPPVLVGFSEGLAASTYSNYALARRRFADATLRPLWRNFAGSMEVLVNMPGGAALWYDDRDIPFLAADEKDEADVQLTRATAMRLLVDAGFDPDSIVQSIDANDFTLLAHSGLYSVQLHPPGSQSPLGQGNTNPSDDQNGNGNGNGNGNENVDNGGEESVTSAAGRATILKKIGNVQELAQALLDAKAGGN